MLGRTDAAQTTAGAPGGTAPRPWGTLTRRRTKRGLKLNKAELARKLNVAPSTVGDWEDGRRPPHRKHYAKLSAALGWPPEEIHQAVFRHWVRHPGPGPPRSKSPEKRPAA